MKYLGITTIIIFSAIVAWYIGEGLFYLAVLFKPMTPIGILVERSIIQIIIFGLLIVASISSFTEFLDKRKKVKVK